MNNVNNSKGESEREDENRVYCIDVHLKEYTGRGRTLLSVQSVRTRPAYKELVEPAFINLPVAPN